MNAIYTIGTYSSSAFIANRQINVEFVFVFLFFKLVF